MRPADREPLVIEEQLALRIRNGRTEYFFDEHASYTWDDGSSFRPTEAEPSIAQTEVGWHGESVLAWTSEIGNIEIPEPTSVDIEERKRIKLPIDDYEDYICDIVEENQVTIIVSQTGSGKSTRLPTMLYRRHPERMVELTQPRRAASLNVFMRILEELGIEYGVDKAQELARYQTAGSSQGPETAPIKIPTDGLLYAKHLNNMDKADLLNNLTVIVDEVHEGNANIDAYLAVLYRLLPNHPGLRVLLASATADAEHYVNYFHRVTDNEPQVVEVYGRNHKINRIEKPESTVVNETILAAEEIIASGSVEDAEAQNGILVFVPGKREINDVIDELLNRMPPELRKIAQIFPLHARLPVAEQQAAIAKHPGVKIVVSTDIAETSLTIPDIKYVIDSGLHRRMELDGGGVQGLALRVISQAQADQRAGRAGRVAEGYAISTRLNTSTEYVPYISREKYPIPEILRTDVVRHVLRFAGVEIDMRHVRLPHPVRPDLIEKSFSTLQMLGAFDETGAITPLGVKMNQFPIRPSSARMLAEASRYSNNTRAYVAAIAAAVEVGGLPYYAPDVERRWKELTEETESDYLAQLDMFIAIQGMDQRAMRDYDLDLNNIERARELYWKLVKRSNANQDTLLPPTQDERDDITKCIVSGLITSVYKHIGDGQYVHVGDPGQIREISNRSLVSGFPQIIVGNAYRVEYPKGGSREEKHVIEQVTKASLGHLASSASGLTEWRPESLTMRGGKFVEVRRLHLFGIDLGVTEEAAATPSVTLRKTVIDHVLANPGAMQRELRGIKKELEVLAHLAKDPVKQFTHEQIKALIEESAPSDITDPEMIDVRLRELVTARGISLDSIVSPERRQRIINDAPPFLTIGDITLKLSYKQGKVIASKFRKADILALPNEDIFLPDGRQVVFAYKDGDNPVKRIGIHALKEKLEAQP